MTRYWNHRLVTTAFGCLLAGTLAACGTPATGGAPVLPSATVITIGTRATPAASATARADQATLQPTLLAQIDEYEHELAAATAAGRCGSPIAATPTGPCKDQVLRVMRERYAEFVAYFSWLERDFNCGPNPGPNTVCTLVGILPSPAEMRDPDKLNRYLDAAAR